MNSRARRSGGIAATAVAAAEHKQREGALGIGLYVWLARPLHDQIAHGITGEPRFLQQIAIEILHLLEGSRDCRDALQKHAVGPAQHRILFMQRRGHASQRGRHQRRERRIAAEPDDCGRLDCPHQPVGGDDTAREHDRSTPEAENGAA